MTVQNIILKIILLRMGRVFSILTLFVVLLLSFNCQEKISDQISPKDFNKNAGAKPFSKKRDYWSTQAWRLKSPQEARVNSQALKDLEEYLFKVTGKDSERRGIRTDGVVIIKNGYLVYEHYARDYTKEDKHLAWSVTKSFVNSLYGVAVKEGRLKLSDSAYRYFPPLDRPDTRKVTIKNLLEHSSGINWEETYEVAPLTSSVVAMLYTAGRKDMAKFVGSRRIESEAESFWEYSSGNTNLLMGILKNILKEEYIDYPWNKIFNVIGMRNVTWERDGNGNYVGSSYLYSTPREMAKFGFLYLNDGVWDNQRLLPEGWVEYSGKIIESYFETSYSLNDIKEQSPSPSAHWWGNHLVSQKDHELRSIPKFPHDMLLALGHWGQSITVIPSLDVVAVRTADDRDKSYLAPYLEKLFAVVKD